MIHIVLRMRPRLRLVLHGELSERSGEAARAKGGQAHGHPAPKRKHQLVTLMRPLRDAGDGARSRETSAVALDPAGTGRRHRDSRKLRLGEREHGEELAAALQYLFGDEKVCARGKRAEGDPDAQPRKLPCDGRAHTLLAALRQSASRLSRSARGAAVVNHAWRREWLEERGVEPLHAADLDELPARAREVPQVATGLLRRGRDGRRRGRDVAHKEQSLGPSRRGVVPLFRWWEFREELSRELRRCLGISGEQGHGGGVDARVVAACPLVDPRVRPRGALGVSRPLVPARLVEAHLGEPPGERREIFVRDVVQTPRPVELFRRIGRAAVEQSE